MMQSIYKKTWGYTYLMLASPLKHGVVKFQKAEEITASNKHTGYMN